MDRVEKTIFLSYRRTNAPWALAIFQNLTQHGFDVFFDYSGVASGDFEQVILGNILARAHFLVLLTPSALERCGEEGDWLRREIETAMKGKRNIVPLMLEGFNFGAPTIANQLTGGLAGLRRYNGLRIPPDYFSEAMERLRRKYLNVPLTAVLHPASAMAERRAREEKIEASEKPAVREEELTAQQWFERGFAAVDLDDKARFYGEAIRLKSDYAEAFNNRGNVRYKKRDLEGAIADYNEGIRLKPDEADAFYNRGIARSDKGDLEGAIADYSEAIRLKTQFAEAFSNRGIARRRKGDLEGAVADYNEAIRLKMQFAQEFRNRLIARTRKGDMAGAIADNNEAIRLKRECAAAFYNRGNARYGGGDLEGAIADYGEAIRLKPDYSKAFYNRGIARLEKGDLEGAIADYSEAIELQPDDAEAFYNRALARFEKGDVEGAKKDQDEAARLGFKPGS